MCAFSASGVSDSDSDLDYGNNGFGAGRGKVVKAMKSATQGNLTGAPGHPGLLSLRQAADFAFPCTLPPPHPCLYILAPHLSWDLIFWYVQKIVYAHQFVFWYNLHDISVQSVRILFPNLASPKKSPIELSQ